MSWVRKCRMRDSPRATVIDRIVTLDKHRLIRPLRVLEVPSMIRIRLDRVCLSLAIRVDQCSGDKVALGHGMGVRKRERVSEDGLNGTPNL
jgi:hypothetical protein